MSKYSWNDEGMEIFCARCHWRDKDPDLCHAVEPPYVKKYIPTKNMDCGFIPDSYWDRIPQERKDEFNEDVRIRSDKFYKHR